MKKNKKAQYKKGFTLIETLVSIYILVLVIVLPISVSYIGISQANQSRDRLIAGYLAQEAIEFVRQQVAVNIQDTNTDNPLHGLNKCDNGWCTIDTLEGDQGNGGLLIKQDPVSKAYGYKNGWVETNINRDIRVLSDGGVANADKIEYQIEVRMEWGKVGSRKTLLLKENIRTWMKLI